ncbi:MAG: tRNA (adenosine(37)-N6)-threonylcarbamoyltransferase complex dimerization subunit type 1 TsaB [Clostridia bacterium]|nr:tRNA (adenosine(37)-N6)-threonylcarbamoyltransferase complex dimerization subunit type 1 TsaB [Clostridia bacterium]
MKILAIDTSSELCSTSILENEVVIDENNLDNGKTHSENLMPLIEELLLRNSVKLADIDLIACSVGPGSFTGIRIGVSSIKAISEVLGVPVAAVTSLETLARNVEKENSTIVSMIDAKNDQVYCGIFDSSYNKKEEYIADNIENVIERLENYENLVFVGNGATLHRELLESRLECLEFENNNRQSAINVGKLGYKKFKEKEEILNADTITPIYLRKSQAERMKNK